MTREEEFKEEAYRWCQDNNFHIFYPFYPNETSEVKAFFAGAKYAESTIKYSKMFKELAHKYEELKLENEKLRNQWISIEDRLPEEDVKVFVMSCRGEASILYMHGGTWCSDNLDYVDDDLITHWMHIPEIRKEE